MSSPTLKIRCPTWDHLENFYERKIKDGNILLARVPFSPAADSSIVVALELPDGVVIDIDATVDGVRQAPGGRKSAIRMVLRGMNPALLGRLASAVQQGRDGAGSKQDLTTPPPSVPRTDTGASIPIPSDVPIDELVEAVVLPKLEDVPEASRERYRELSEYLSGLREKATHDILGVAWDADVEAIRQAYFKLVKQHHPDVLAKHASPEISVLASEVFIYINKAYDRLRDSAVASGKAIAAGPALLPHTGWIADFKDLGSVRPRAPLRSTELSDSKATLVSSAARTVPVDVQFSNDGPAPTERAPAQATEESREGLKDTDLFTDARKTESGMQPLEKHAKTAEAQEAAAAEELDVAALVETSEKKLAEGAHDEAREILAQVLDLRPRDRGVRALYHVAYGYTLLNRHKAVEAMTQFEVALKHDPKCQPARNAKSAFSKSRRARPSLFKRLFRR